MRCQISGIVYFPALQSIEHDHWDSTGHVHKRHQTKITIGATNARFQYGYLIVLSLVSIEFSVAAFVDPAASRLDPGPQLKLLSGLASVLGKLMSVWYPLSAILFGVQTWLVWQTAGREVLLVAGAIWPLASVDRSFSLFRPIPVSPKVIPTGSGYTVSGIRDIACELPLSRLQSSCSHM